MNPITAQLIAKVHEIGPLLKENAAKADSDRRMPEASVDALEAAGVFLINSPKEYLISNDPQHSSE